MSSSHKRVGPWPIKRSQSVPDASAPLFTPGNSPSSLSRLLVEVEEERCKLEHRPPPPSSPSSSKPQFRTTNWFNDSRYQRSVDLEKNSSSRRTHKPVKPTALDNEAAAVRATVLVALCIYTIVPLHITSYFRGEEPTRLTLPAKAPSSVLVYTLICLFAMMIGMVVSIAWSSPMLRKHIKLGVRRKKRMLAMNGLIVGTLLSIWWICFVLPPIVHEKATGV